ncbi:hypothetical protein ACI2K4_26265 [Micromonospora sp. NPDC050397]|uniref:hypothetical protein n=1 Tax=Micromonospora sp. NPDC050397 TaxID=3364279 RepID=UPI00384E63A3
MPPTPAVLPTLAALARPTAYAINWTPLFAGGTVGLLLVTVSAVLPVVLSLADLTTLLRFAMVAGALGAAFLLDDPAAYGTEVVPTGRPLRWLLRVLVALPGLVIWWAALVAVTVRGAEAGVGQALPVADLTVEAAAIVALAVGLAALARRRGGTGGTGVGGVGGVGSVVAGPGLLVGLVTLYLLPARLVFFVEPDDPRWGPAHDRWAALLVVALVCLAWAAREPVRRFGPALARRISG